MCLMGSRTSPNCRGSISRRTWCPRYCSLELGVHVVRPCKDHVVRGQQLPGLELTLASAGEPSLEPCPSAPKPLPSSADLSCCLGWQQWQVSFFFCGLTDCASSSSLRCHGQYLKRHSQALGSITETNMCFPPLPKPRPRPCGCGDIACTYCLHLGCLRTELLLRCLQRQ